MQNEIVNNQPVSNEEFGMTEEDVKSYKVNNFLSRIKYFLESIEPTLVKILNVTIYYTVRFIKSFVTSIVKMAFKGGE